jgi:hypothetical protein
MPLKFRAAARIPGFSLGANFSRIGGLVALVDTIYLLNRAGAGFSWEWILRTVNRSIPATYLYLLLRYDLVKIVPGLMRELSFSQRSFGRLGLKLIRRMTDITS